MRVVIVDDEKPAREELKLLLKSTPNIEVVGEAGAAAEAIALIESIQPAVVFLDVELPGISGFEILESLQEPKPKVIITTAFENFAIDAFRVAAVDYLLKPINPEHLAAAVERIADQTPSAPGASSEQLLRAEDKVLVRDNTKCYFIRVDSIRILESDGNYTRLLFEGNKPMIYRSMKTLEARLDPKTFFRANRKQIINLSFIKSVDYDVEGNLVAHMLCGTPVVMSRRMAQLFRERWEI